MGHDPLVDPGPGSPEKLFLPRWFSFFFSESERWTERHPCEYLPSQHHLFHGTRGRDYLGEPEIVSMSDPLDVLSIFMV